ncbi:HNH endonuclease signature motif containing protein [Psychrobacillus sp.]|uniref:HNH endonuclease signature motif containing protein n=1 Tax=Psychrobacillus sp. TaxID=1871623 RepID=UPI0028BE2D34|nr:HNH endonuclease signature motif containing protein [Psychrobacillus sp.]
MDKTNYTSRKRVGDKIYHTSAWRKLRQSYYGSQYGMCERCDAPGDIVHHKIHITKENVNDPSVTLNADNLELLCHSCHNKEHKQVYSPIRNELKFDEFGNLVKKT